MKVQPKRLSILSLPEVQEIYSVPNLNQHERDYFFTITEEELAQVNRLNLHRNRIHLILMLGYFKVKPVFLIYRWKNIADDYRYVSERYFPKASKKNKNMTRQTRSRLYNMVFDLVGCQRCNKSTEAELRAHLQRRAKYYIDEAHLFYDAMTYLQSKEVVVPGYSKLQDIISSAINTEETRLAQLIDKHLVNKKQFLYLLDGDNKQGKLNNLKKMSKAYKSGENKREISRHHTLSELSKDAFRIIKKLKLTQGNIGYFAALCQTYNIRDLRELKIEKTLIYLICFVATRLQISNDILTTLFLVAFKEINDSAKVYQDECVKQQSLELANSIEHVPLLLDLFVDKDINNSTDLGTVRDGAFDIISEDRIPLVSQRMSKIKPDKTLFKWEIDAGYKMLFTTALSLTESLEIAELKGELKKKINTFCKSDLVIIDELGYLPMNKQGNYNAQSLIFRGSKLLSARGSKLMAIDNWKTFQAIGAGVKEIRISDDGNAYRVMYVAKFEGRIYVLHSFQKKSQKTRPKDIEIAKVRYNAIVKEEQ